MQKLLTDIYLSRLRPPASGRLEIADTAARGLTYRLSASGAQSWSFRFRDPASGRVTRQTFSGDLTLKAARAAALVARGFVAQGQNPVEAKRRDRQEAATRTFDALAARYMAEHARRHKRTADADDRMLRLHVLPQWGKRRYDKIGRADVIELCEGIVTAGSPVQANRVQALVSKIFSFALDADLITSHPSARLKKRTRETAATRTLNDNEIRLFWRDVGLAPNSQRIGQALRLVLLTGARVNEVAGALIAEFDRIDEPETATWTIPASRSKNGKAHVVPLSEMARNIAFSMIAASSEDKKTGAAGFLLASPAARGGPIAGHALSVAMLRFGATMAKRTEKADAVASKSWQFEQPSAHDLRRTMATRLSAAGVPAEDISACLNHTRKGVTATHYDHYDRAREKRRAFAIWASLVKVVVEEQGAKNVIFLRAAPETVSS